MNTLLNSALDLAAKGFYIFPLRPGGKKPAIENFPELATRDPDQIKIWWAHNPQYNIGISTSEYNGEGEHLVAIDVDNKGEKKGDAEILKLIQEGLSLPKTFEQVTPTGGRHLIYKTTEALSQSPLGSALDIRAYHGYLVGAGSVIDGKKYYCFDVEVANATESLISRLKKAREKKNLDLIRTPVEVDQIRAMKRAQHYLENEAPVAIQGQRGDQTTFQVACKLKDFGLTPDGAVEAMESYWNDRCSPPWEPIDLRMKIENAYQYGRDFAGASAPEVIFGEPEPDDKLHPILELNKQYAFIMVKGKSFVISESKHEGKFALEYMTTHSFREKLLPQTLMFGDKKLQLADLWLKSPDRRSYDGICFMPGQECPPNLYNLWRGFAYEPKEATDPRASEALSLFLDHTLENICAGEPTVYDWLIGYFAHLIQKPWDKPMVAPVFKGGKGVGKNSFIEIIGELLNGHYLLVSDPRYLMGNFNSHLENCLLFVLDEAFWSGDKKAEGRLKDVITGKTHLIERKGSEAYTVRNCTRVVIIGNEGWLVPASHDERRFAVFNVGSQRKNDHKFFNTIRKGMAAGGYSALLKYLNEFDLEGINVNQAPVTIGLIEQKISSLSPFYDWWFECLREGRIVHADFSTTWDLEVDREHFRLAYRRYVKERNINKYGETDSQLGRLLNECLPSVRQGKKQVDGVRVNTYHMPSLETCRKEWDAWIGHPFAWS